MDASETSVMLKKKRVLEVGGMFRRDAPSLELGCDPKTRMNPQLFENGLRNDARDFESFASAIPPHRLIFNFETLVPVSEDWRDVQEGCKKSCFDKPSKFNAHS